MLSGDLSSRRADAAGRKSACRRRARTVRSTHRRARSRTRRSATSRSDPDGSDLLRRATPPTEQRRRPRPADGPGPETSMFKLYLSEAEPAALGRLAPSRRRRARDSMLGGRGHPRRRPSHRSTRGSGSTARPRPSSAARRRSSSTSSPSACLACPTSEAGDTDVPRLDRRTGTAAATPRNDFVKPTNARDRRLCGNCATPSPAARASTARSSGRRWPSIGWAGIP